MNALVVGDDGAAVTRRVREENLIWSCLGKRIDRASNRPAQATQSGDDRFPDMVVREQREPHSAAGLEEPISLCLALVKALRL